MPFPATRHTVPDVGSAGGQRPGAFPCAHAQVGGLLRCGEFEDWQIRPLDVREIRRPHIRNLPKETVAAPLARQAHGHRARQCPIPPCHIVGTLVMQIPQDVDPAVLAAIQPATGSRRAGLETGAASGYTQPVLRHIGRFAMCSRVMFRLVEKTECGTVQIMRHYLRRYV